MQQSNRQEKLKDHNAPDLFLAVIVSAVVVVSTFLDALWDENHPIHETIEVIGIALILCYLFGRVLCACYSSDKDCMALKRGPYSICRNPLHALSVVAATGVAALSGSLTITIATAIIASLFNFVIALAHEEKRIRRCGKSYIEYVKAVPCLLPRLQLWRADTTISVPTHMVGTTFARSSPILVLIVLMEAIELLKEGGVLPILLKLP